MKYKHFYSRFELGSPDISSSSSSLFWQLIIYIYIYIYIYIIGGLYIYVYIIGGFYIYIYIYIYIYYGLFIWVYIYIYIYHGLFLYIYIYEIWVVYINRERVCVVFYACISIDNRFDFVFNNSYLHMICLLVSSSFFLTLLFSYILPLLSLLFPSLSFFHSFLSFLLLSCLNSLFLLMILFVLYYCLKQSCDMFLNMNADLLIKGLFPFSVYIICSLFYISIKIHQWSNVTQYNIF